jgi:3-hydroxy acid dehydrogenase / malonic semialdehyde reductase
MPIKGGSVTGLIPHPVAVITGASSGIGLACARVFAREGYNLAVCARRGERLVAVSRELREMGTELFTGTVDIRNRTEVEEFAKSIPTTLGVVSVLINNAGLARGFEPFQENDPADWDEMIDTNVKGLLWMTKAILPGMISRGRGHIINIGSLAGTAAYPRGAVYCATKAAVKFISDGIRMDIASSPLRVTNIQPGMVDTEFSAVRFHGDTDRAAGVYSGITPMSGEDIAEIALFAATRPAHVQISEITVTATHQASAMVVHRNVK